MHGHCLVERSDLHLCFSSGVLAVLLSSIQKGVSYSWCLPRGVLAVLLSLMQKGVSYSWRLPRGGSCGVVGYDEKRKKRGVSYSWRLRSEMSWGVDGCDENNKKKKKRGFHTHGVCLGVLAVLLGTAKTTKKGDFEYGDCAR